MKREASSEKLSPSAREGGPRPRLDSGLELLGAAFDAVLLTDREGVVLAAGGATAELLGHRPEEVVGRALDELVVAPPARTTGTAKGPLSAVDSFPYEGRLMRLTALHAGGGRLAVEGNVAEVDGTDGVRFVTFLRDVSELRESRAARRLAERQLDDAREQLRTLTLKLPLEVESERRRIARGLHDQVGNELAMAKMGLGELRRQVADGQVESLDQIEGRIAKAMQEIRSLTFELSSPVLYELGLEAALKSLGKRLAEQHEIAFEFNRDDRPKPLSEARQVILYRVIEELLINVVKHAWASRARIAVERGGDEIRITVEDDGVGLGEGEGRLPGPDGGFGLFGVRQRLAHLDGRLDLEAAFPSGTRVTVTAPLDGEEE